MAGLRELGQDYQIAAALKDGVLGKNCYDHPDECRYVLWSYEEHLAQEMGAGATIDENEKIGIWKLRATDSIEHIFPQTPSEEWADELFSGQERTQWSHLGMIGNLLLLPIRLNQEAQALPFKRKKEIYAKHNLRMVQEVCHENHWTGTEIDARQARIAEWAKSRWNDV